MRARTLATSDEFGREDGTSHQSCKLKGSIGRAGPRFNTHKNSHDSTMKKGPFYHCQEDPESIAHENLHEY